VRNEHGCLTWSERCVTVLEILYLNWNRRDFAKRSFKALADNTNWLKVSRLVVYDDGSEDGADEIVYEMGMKVPVPAFEFRRVRFRSPPITMNDFLSQTDADLFVKIDSDICVPKGWLQAMMGVMENNPDLELLGMEAGRGERPGKTNNYSYVPSSHIGGVGLMRVRSFHTRRAIPGWGYQGFTHWQTKLNPTRGFIDPYILCPALDRIPVDPWASLSEHYHEKGWQRKILSWRYRPEATYLWDWL
jgi:hypothetical protein